jgi:DNA polymerase-1
LEIEPWKFTDKGEPSVEEEVLEQIHDPVLDLCLEYKHLFKDRKTYVENYIKMKDKNNRIHPELKQTSTSTRRLSCAKPNLQNVFKKGERIKLRALFSAKKGFKIVRMDYDQLDFKALGAITQDEKLLAAFKSGKKIHTVTSEEMNLPYDQAKIANFAVMFKVEPWSLSIQMGCSIDEAKDFMARYFQKFPAIKRYQDETEKIVREEKRVTIPFENAVRRIDSMYSENWKIMQAGVREGINLPVQGLESYVVKRAMLDLYYKHNLTPILQIHDELLFEVEEEKALEFACWLKEYIPTIVGELGGVSFAVEVGIGNNWYEAGLKENTVKGE